MGRIRYRFEQNSLRTMCFCMIINKIVTTVVAHGLNGLDTKLK